MNHMHASLRRLTGRDPAVLTRSAIAGHRFARKNKKAFSIGTGMMGQHIADRISLPRALHGNLSPASASEIACPPDGREALVSKIQEANARWRSGFAQMQRQDMDFAIRLARCTDPVEAMQLCREWTESRIDFAMSMQSRFLDLWLKGASAPGPLVENEMMPSEPSNSTR